MKGGAVKPDYYWTAFGFEDFGINTLHCTHKYFGGLDLCDEDAVAWMIDGYFKKNPGTAFTPTFDRKAKFGRNEDEPVLVCDRDYLFYPDLKQGLDVFKDDQYPKYQPHVSCDELWGQFSSKVDRYYFVKNKTVLREWELEG
jgi:hypothetical protein